MRYPLKYEVVVYKEGKLYYWLLKDLTSRETHATSRPYTRADHARKIAQSFLITDRDRVKFTDLTNPKPDRWA